ncbi:MAG TPA: GFA family protein [Polyangia bacterium]|jgi:hypothetical protein|nr:GFA family protein [Polyangia bacterium]
MSEPKSYTGGCHCGQVRYQATLDLSGTVISCNCSMCGRSGTLLSFIPATQFTLLSGDDALTDYQFNKKRIHHLFCKSCGIKAFARGNNADGSAMVAINTRCLDDVDLEQLNIKKFDGKHR